MEPILHFQTQVLGFWGGLRFSPHSLRAQLPALDEKDSGKKHQVESGAMAHKEMMKGEMENWQFQD